MWRHKQFFFLLVVLAIPIPVSFAQQIHVSSVRYVAARNQSNVVLAVSESPKHRVFVLDNPSRLVIDVKNAQVDRGLSQPSVSHPLFAHVRAAPKNGSDVRIVIDLKQSVTAKTHKLATNNSDNRHLIVNLVDKDSTTAANTGRKVSEKLTKLQANDIEEHIEKASTSSSKHKTNKKERFIVAIDAGHGGDDPGARGPSGTQEKQVTLAIAKKLQALISGQPGMKAKLVRKGDYYVGLRERMKIARQAGADLFISIHADAVNNPDVRGASVYTLSRNGASSEAARWLANSENAKEKVGGVNLDDKDEVLATVLMDLSQTATQQASLNLADKVLKNFHHIGDLHYGSVQKAGFAVLKSPDIPSILVETAYISNPSDELNLMSDRYQTKMAHAIFKGILNYFEQMEPLETDRVAKL
ncbi:N-acetylmuramoyl-L-alanine amidase AmiC [Methyloglobulus morosus KoM1]|uniref:N-acetylmuramoyl-L-alanine amidase AmiC n=1 Tax=Methyloglobulus morosus KoM1 TaxID=1116472 RepID=V5E212_9GAMM|nr:N-acetylmuramoyl-L-alanine amidase [Methyloglobulus morosus]ESS73591.1 N-acetylmuramoyl-L-alanine amidase AmiC [Methyloglobulus morosus KoM1]